MRIYLGLLCFIFLTVGLSYGQEKNDLETFLIITYERSYNKGNHGIESYYWIISSDSIDSVDSFSPLYFSGYSKTLFDKCLKDEVVYPFDTFTNDNYDFSEKYLNIQGTILNIIEHHREKVITINKKFMSGLKEKLNVYVTPVRGDFCDCAIDKNSSQRINYYGKIYLPVGDISFLSTYDIDTLDIFKLHNKMKLNDVSNVPWR